MTENDKKTKDTHMEAFCVYPCACIWAEMFRKFAIQFSLEIQRFSLSIELFNAMANVSTLFFFYKNIFYKNIKAEIRKILRIFQE